MIARIVGAGMRGFLVALMIATPSLLLQEYVQSASEIIALLAILSAVLVFIEYASHYPSFVEFRDAPPLNRIRFLSLFAMIFAVSILCKHSLSPDALTQATYALAVKFTNMLNFPFSPVNLLLQALPAGTNSTTSALIQVIAGMSYFIALVAIMAFILAVRVFGWPIGSGTFNVWVNLPLFDPTSGGDVVYRLHRDGRVNVAIGAAAPFVAPALIKLASGYIALPEMASVHSIIWFTCAWAFLPASMCMRGFAMLRIADLIEEKRRRAYAETVQLA